MSELENQAAENATSNLMKGILNELEDEQTEKELEEEEEATEEAETEDEQTEKELEEKSPEAVITPEMAKAWGLPKEMAGKPIEEAGKSYRNLLAEFTKKNAELAELKKVKKPESDIEEIPDPLEDLEGFKSWVKQFKESMTGTVEENVKPIQEARKAQAIKESLDNIQSKLPKDVDVSQLLNEWGDYNELSEDDYQEYLDNPKRFVKPVIDFYYAKEYKAKLKQAEKKSKDLFIKSQRNEQADTSINTYNKSRPEESNDVFKRLIKELS